MTDQELESVWQDAKNGNQGSIAPSAVYMLLSRIKKGSGWHISSEFQDMFLGKVQGLDVFRRGMGGALVTHQYAKITIEDYIAMIDPFVIPLLKHVAKKPSAMKDDGKEVKTAVACYLTNYVRDYRERCWCYHQLLTGGTEFTMTYPNNQIRFDLDTISAKKVVVKSDKTVNNQELQKLSKIMIGCDEFDIYDEWVLKEKAPMFEVSERYQDMRPLRDTYFSSDIFDMEAGKVTEWAQQAAIEAQRFSEFDTMIRARYPKTWEERWLAIMEVFIDKAPTLMDSRRHSQLNIAELCKLSLKAGFTAKEIVECMVKIRDRQEASHGN